jgi:hypothetical protein
VGTPLLRQISLIDNGVLDKTEETPVNCRLTKFSKFDKGQVAKPDGRLGFFEDVNIEP